MLFISCFILSFILRIIVTKKLRLIYINSAFDYFTYTIIYFLTLAYIFFININSFIILITFLVFLIFLLPLFSIFLKKKYIESLNMNITIKKVFIL